MIYDHNCNFLLNSTKCWSDNTMRMLSLLHMANQNSIHKDRVDQYAKAHKGQKKTTKKHDKHDFQTNKKRGGVEFNQ